MGGVDLRSDEPLFGIICAQREDLIFAAGCFLHSKSRSPACHMRHGSPQSPEKPLFVVLKGNLQ